MFCLLVVLVELSVLAKWLARKTPLRKPSRGEGIISRKPRPKSAHDFLGLLYCFIVLLCICVVSCPYVIYYPTVMAGYSLFVLKVVLNPKQTNKDDANALIDTAVMHSWTCPPRLQLVAALPWEVQKCELFKEFYSAKFRWLRRSNYWTVEHVCMCVSMWWQTSSLSEDQSAAPAAAAGEFDVFRLQLVRGKVSPVDEAVDSFSDVYVGPNTSHLVTNLEHNVLYSLRVSGAHCDSTAAAADADSVSWSPWSLPVTWSTSLPRRGLYSVTASCLLFTLCKLVVQ